jgi:hypothetical protein
METGKGHLTYCTNIHAGESWSEHFSALKKHFPGIKKKASPNAPMGIGLRLSDIASRELASTSSDFIEWLKKQDAYVFTMNGFPYGGFHHTRVKDQVHAPDWTTTERVDYTIRLFEILSLLLPEGIDGGVSTSPLSYRYWFNTDDASSNARREATRNIIRVVEHLIHIRKRTSQVMHLDIEPEPDGMLETGEEFITWFESSLLPLGKDYLTAVFHISRDEAETLLKDHVRLCYDICHFAIGYEDHEKVIRTLRTKGIQIGKFQVSAALKAMIAAGKSARKAAAAAFSGFDEPTYLHQVVARMKDNTLIRYHDLPEALQTLPSSKDVREWRAHFHVPVFAQDLGLVQSTQEDITKVLKMQRDFMLTNHLEVETYTWEVLPEELKLPMGESIVRELEWVKGEL